MRIFSALYNRMMLWASHRHAPYYLGVISFTESSFFPIPPDVMLAPMSLAQPKRAWWYATLTTITAVLGAFVGYIIGMFFFDFVHPLIIEFGYQLTYEQVQNWFETWGFWVLVFAGSVSPVPFKLFTIAAGALHMSLFPFFVGALVGRSIRYYFISGLMILGGKRMDEMLRRSVDWLGWIVLVLLVIGYIIYKCYA